jgi:hypothetical protein
MSGDGMTIRLWGILMALATALVGAGLSARGAEAPAAESPVKAPAGAIVLFDGTDASKWVSVEGAKPCPWKIVDGAMEVNGTGYIQTKDSYGDYTLHVEFRTPEPKEGQTGQNRGNSGVYLAGRYEIQILESFGLAPLKDGCGSIYSRKAPDVNAALPPMQWQTYDITFRAPRFDNSGAKNQNARVTVIWNGRKVHDNVEIEGPTRAGETDEKPGPAPVRLQDHGHPVQFRNIWIVPAK